MRIDQPGLADAASGLPDFAIELVQRPLLLHERNGTGLVLAASILGTSRDPSNVAGDLRQLPDAIEYQACHHTGEQPVHLPRP